MGDVIYIGILQDYDGSDIVGAFSCEADAKKSVCDAASSERFTHCNGVAPHTVSFYWRQGVVLCIEIDGEERQSRVVWDRESDDEYGNEVQETCEWCEND